MASDRFEYCIRDEGFVPTTSALLARYGQTFDLPENKSTELKCTMAHMTPPPGITHGGLHFRIAKYPGVQR